METEITTARLEKKLESIFAQHKMQLPRDLKFSLVGLIAAEKAAVVNQTLSDVVREYSRWDRQDKGRQLKLPPLQDIESPKVRKV